MQTQYQMTYEARQYKIKKDQLILQMVRDGMTEQQLQRSIEQRPTLWRRFEHWLDKLPS